MLAARRLAPLVAFVFILSAPSRAQCLDWKPGFGSPIAGTNGVVHASAWFDDGSGPALYVGGSFTRANDATAVNLARWNGEEWEPAGSVAAGYPTVLSLCVYDAGSGPALYAGTGSGASSVIRWNGSSWSTVAGSPNGPVHALTVHDEGFGPRLYAGGLFNGVGPGQALYAPRVARWDGADWSAVGGGIPGLVGEVRALAWYDAGGGPELYAGGSFTASVEFPYSYLARFDGTGWVSGMALDGEVDALRVFDDGSGSSLFVAGSFGNAAPLSPGGDPRGIVRWQGTEFSALAGGLSSANGAVPGVRALEIFDPGSGPRLYAGGAFDRANGQPANRIASWDGASWSPLSSGIVGPSVETLCGFDDGSGAALYAAGEFGAAGSSTSYNVARWQVGAWSSVGTAHAGTDGPVRAIAVFDDGSGPALYAAGAFGVAGTGPASRIARWQGNGWTPLGSGFDSEVKALCVYDDGQGPKLYAGGLFGHAGGVIAKRIARWDGSSWSALGTGISFSTSAAPVVDALAVFDAGSGPALYAGGSFDRAGGAIANNVARWNGTSWAPLAGGTNGEVFALRAFSELGGSALYVGGNFSWAGDGQAFNVARWNGAHWTAVGGGFSNRVYALATHDFGNGPTLVAGGTFAGLVAVWSGSQWTVLMSDYYPFGSHVSALASFDDGGGPALFAAGVLGTIAGSPLNGLAKYRGAGWTAVAGGLLQGTPWAYAAIDALCPSVDLPGGSPALFVGGTFTTAGGAPASNIAAWRGCNLPVTSFCAGDGSLAACPCANSGTTGHGCENSAATGGALLASSGTTDPDTLVLDASGGTPTGTMVFLQGTQNLAPISFGDGLRCVGGTLLRLYVKPAVGGSASAPSGADPSITARSLELGGAVISGAIRYYQVYYRDAVVAFCPAPLGQTWNVTNGLAVAW